MVERVELKLDRVEWVARRSGLSDREVIDKVRKGAKTATSLEDLTKLTARQCEDLARLAYMPTCYLFTEKPPPDTPPIKDFRGGSTGEIDPISLSVIYDAQSKQDWYREYLIEEEVGSLDFVNSFRVGDDHREVAQSIRDTFSFDELDKCSNYKSKISTLIAACWHEGILAIKSNTLRHNSGTIPDESFRGFALVDEYAPLIFIRGSDALSAQLFTIAHELAHLWIGQSGIGDSDPMKKSQAEVETFCNKVAAECLVPEDKFREDWKALSGPEASKIERLHKKYNVSKIVIAIRAKSFGFITEGAVQEVGRESTGSIKEQGGGGNFWNTFSYKVGGQEFIEAVRRSTLSGRTLYRDAYKLLGTKPSAFKEIPRRIQS